MRYRSYLSTGAAGTASDDGCEVVLSPLVSVPVPLPTPTRPLLLSEVLDELPSRPGGPAAAGAFFPPSPRAAPDVPHRWIALPEFVMLTPSPPLPPEAWGAVSTRSRDPRLVSSQSPTLPTTPDAPREFIPSGSASTRVPSAPSAARPMIDLPEPRVQRLREAAAPKEYPSSSVVRGRTTDQPRGKHLNVARDGVRIGRRREEPVAYALPVDKLLASVSIGNVSLCRGEQSSSVEDASKPRDGGELERVVSLDEPLLAAPSSVLNSESSDGGGSGMMPPLIKS